MRADNQASPRYTVLTVESDDRPGLLHAITAAIANADARIHSARISTSETGHVVDLFDISDFHGAKLSSDRIDAIVATIHAGISPAPMRRRSFLRAARGEW